MKVEEEFEQDFIEMYSSPQSTTVVSRHKEDLSILNPVPELSVHDPSSLTLLSPLGVN